MRKEGMATQALAGEIAAAVLADENDGGCDISAGLFGPAFSAIIRKIATEYVRPTAAPGIDVTCTARISELEAQVKELDRLCDATYVAQGADAYNHACDMLEQFQAARAAAGKEIGTEGSLCDGMAWLYGRLDELEAQIDASPKGGSTGETCCMPTIATTDMLEAGWPRNERIDDQFDRQGAYADLLAAAMQATSAEVKS